MSPSENMMLLNPYEIILTIDAIIITVEIKGRLFALGNILKDNWSTEA